jgi:hypothetical protein
MKKNDIVESIITFMFIVYCVISCVIIIYVSMDIQKSIYNNTNSTLYMTLEYLIIPALILGGVIFVVLWQKFYDMFR